MQRRDHFPTLDGLRGIGALLVMALHIQCAEPGLKIAGRGYLAVDFFFMLSGFVIGLRYHARLASANLSVASYMRLRLIRLYPLILVGLVLGTVRWHGLAPVESAGDLAERVIAQLLIFPALWTSFHLFLLNGPQWSLFFELVANWAHALTARLLSLPVLIGIVVVSAILLLIAITHYGTVDIGAQKTDFLGGFPRVVFGFSGGLLVQRLWSTGRWPHWRAGPIIAAIGLPLFILAAPALPASQALSDSILVVLILPAILAVALMGSIASSWEKPAIALGALSYPIYAIHAPLVMLAQDFKDHLPSPLVGTEIVIYWILVAIGIVLFAMIAERLFDRPLRAALTARRRPSVTKAGLLPS